MIKKIQAPANKLERKLQDTLFKSHLDDKDKRKKIIKIINNAPEDEVNYTIRTYQNIIDVLNDGIPKFKKGTRMMTDSLNNLKALCYVITYVHPSSKSERKATPKEYRFTKSELKLAYSRTNKSIGDAIIKASTPSNKLNISPSDLDQYYLMHPRNRAEADALFDKIILGKGEQHHEQPRKTKAISSSSKKRRQ